MKEPLYDREGMARMIRTYFIEHKIHLSPTNKYRPNPRHDTHENWLKAADVCIANGANPSDWVAASFSLSRFEPFANQLAGASAVARWKEYTTRGTDGTPQICHSVNAALNARQALLGVDEQSQIMTDIKDELILAHMLFKQSASKSPYAKDNHAVLNDRFTSIKPHVRVAIAGRAGMTDIVVKFRDPARAYFASRPHQFRCFTSLGYDMQTYLNVT